MKLYSLSRDQLIPFELGEFSSLEAMAVHVTKCYDSGLANMDETVFLTAKDGQILLACDPVDGTIVWGEGNSLDSPPDNLKP